MHIIDAAHDGSIIQHIKENVSDGELWFDLWRCDGPMTNVEGSIDVGADLCVASRTFWITIATTRISEDFSRIKVS